MLATIHDRSLSKVSNQCMALVREKMIVPTKDAPELGYVVESSAKQYVPDVIYKEKDDYGNEVLIRHLVESITTE